MRSKAVAGTKATIEAERVTMNIHLSGLAAVTPY